MEKQFKSKLPDAGTTIFSTISAMAVQHKAVNLGQGFPDYPMDPELANLVHEASKEGYNQYAPMEGVLALREALAEKVQFLYSVTIDPLNEITITPGATYAIFNALATIIFPGDEIIVFEPVFDSYIPGIKVLGGIPVPVPMTKPSYGYNWDEVMRKITPKTKAIIINSPHNPTGTTLNNNDIETLTNIVKKHNLFLISDEVYEHLVYDGEVHNSILKFPELFKHSFVCFSFGKLYHCTGWKVGYCIAPARLMLEYKKVHQYNAFSTNTPAQYGLANFLTKKDKYLSLSGFFQEKRDYFLKLLSETRFKPNHPKGSYFICCSYDAYSYQSDIAFVFDLIKNTGVAAIPLSSFYANNEDQGIIRFCFAKKIETLETGVERLLKLNSGTHFR